MSQNNPFRLPPEPVRPIDPLTWVQHCNAMRGLNIISEGLCLLILLHN